MAIKEGMQQVADAIHFVARELVDDPARVQVEVRDNAIELSAAKSDLGKLIGKRGRTVQSLRRLVESISAKYKCRGAVLEIIE